MKQRKYKVWKVFTGINPWNYTYYIINQEQRKVHSVWSEYVAATVCALGLEQQASQKTPTKKG